MKKFYLTMIFVSTLVGGIGLSNSVDVRGRIDEYIHRDCVRWGEDWHEQPLFSLEEVKKLWRKKVISKNPKFRYKEIGRIVTTQNIGNDKFVVGIYWGNGGESENYLFFWCNKDFFEKNFEVLN